uniref:Putative tick transposon n=1 Tax=Rhipicephalus microplus TaxID=6941 RepID=A0A6M2CYU8_RHIMP
MDSLRQQRTAIAINNIIRYNRPVRSSILWSSSRPTRNTAAGNFNFPPTNNVYGERRLQFVGTKICNRLLQDIKSAVNFPLKIKKNTSLQSLMCLCNPFNSNKIVQTLCISTTTSSESLLRSC